MNITDVAHTGQHWHTRKPQPRMAAACPCLLSIAGSLSELYSYHYILGVKVSMPRKSLGFATKLAICIHSFLNIIIPSSFSKNQEGKFNHSYQCEASRHTSVTFNTNFSTGQSENGQIWSCDSSSHCCCSSGIDTCIHFIKAKPSVIKHQCRQVPRPGLYNLIRHVFSSFLTFSILLQEHSQLN